MADALISPAVGGAAWAASAGLIGFSSRQLKRKLDERRIPLMAVMGAFVFAAQMVNFTIPATGSSGHLGGGLMLAVLLGPSAGFLVIASVLTIQALFFADGGLLALGCNILNLGFWPCFVAYPLIYRKIAGAAQTQGRIVAASIIAAVAGLQLGAFSVVLQTVLSRVSALPFRTFVTLMQPIHLAIGLVEGFATAAVILFVFRARPELVSDSVPTRQAAVSLKAVVIAFLAASAIIGGGVNWFASTHPDGLEWAMKGTSGREELEPPADGVHRPLAGLQERTVILPDYDFKVESGSEKTSVPGWPVVEPGTSVAGLVGGVLTLLAVGAVGVALRRRNSGFKTQDSK